jgi:hypothetical protein
MWRSRTEPRTAGARAGRDLGGERRVGDRGQGLASPRAHDPSRGRVCEPRLGRGLELAGRPEEELAKRGRVELIEAHTEIGEHR